MSNFEQAFNYMIQYEGDKFVDNPDDKGGPTKFGISSKFINSLSFLEQQELPRVIQKDTSKIYLTWPIKEYIKQLDIQPAFMIYQKYFWLPIYERIQNQDIANYIFDMHVNHGQKKAAEIMQRAINAATRNRIDIDIDGVIGNKTIEIANKIINEVLMRPEEKGITGYHIGVAQIKTCLIAIRESFCRCIVAHNQSQQQFLEGWLKRAYGEKL